MSKVLQDLSAQSAAAIESAKEAPAQRRPEPSSAQTTEGLTEMVLYKLLALEEEGTSDARQKVAAILAEYPTIDRAALAAATRHLRLPKTGE